MLCVIETHPIQYHAPVWRQVQQAHGIPVMAIYGSDFSVAGAIDPEFKTRVAWDTDLLSGYKSLFLARVEQGGGGNPNEVSSLGLCDAITGIRPSAVLINGYSPAFHQVAAFGALRARLPILFRGEVNDNAGNRSALKRVVRHVLLRAYYSRVARVLFVGSRAREHYLRHGVSPDRMFFSPYAVDVESHQRFLGNDRQSIREALRAELRIPVGGIALLFAGKLYEAKGPMVLIEALRLLDEATLNSVHLIIMGDGELRARLEAQAAVVLKGRAHFVGFQNQSALGRFFCGADLFVLPSFSETWGLVVNEACLHGLPSVITDRVGCALDLVEPGCTGEVATARSITSLLDALQRALPLVRNSSVAARCRRKAAEYSIQAAARGVADAYHSLLPINNTNAA